MKILITGSHGLIGSALVSYLQSRGQEVLRLVRTQPSSDSEIEWDPAQGQLDPAALEGVDAIVHLAGENIVSGRWSEERKRQILESRVGSTGLLSKTIAQLKDLPKVFIVASATGFYGDRGDQLLDETSEPGSGFLSEVCQQWESATRAAEERGVRVVHLRTGVVLSERGGALGKMLTPFKLGLAGPIGTGRQYMSWIAIDDEVGAIEHVLTNERIRGPINLVAPDAVTNRQFTKSLGQILHRPAILKMPAFAAQLVFGEMADETLLASTRVVPERLLETGYHFQYPRLESALRHVLHRA